MLTFFLHSEVTWITLHKCSISSFRYFQKSAAMQNPCRHNIFEPYIETWYFFFIFRGFIIFCWAPNFVVKWMNKIKCLLKLETWHHFVFVLFTDVRTSLYTGHFHKIHEKLMNLNIKQTTVYKFAISFLDSLPGNYTRVKKALDNPRLYESLMTNPDVAAGNNPLSLTTLDPEVIKFAKDPILLLVLLRTDYTLMNKLMK